MCHVTHLYDTHQHPNSRQMHATSLHGAHHNSDNTSTCVLQDSFIFMTPLHTLTTNRPHSQATPLHGDTTTLITPAQMCNITHLYVRHTNSTQPRTDGKCTHLRCTATSCGWSTATLITPVAVAGVVHRQRETRVL